MSEKQQQISDQQQQLVVLSGEESLNSSDDHHPQEQLNKSNEIPAASVRSGLAELEMQASQVIQRLENLRTNSSDTIQHAQTPGFLPLEKKQPSTILNNLTDIITTTDIDDDSVFPLPSLDEVSHLALVSHSIVAYISNMERQHLNKVASRIVTDTNRWLGHLFRFVDSSASYHSDNTESILRGVRLAILSRCPGYLEGGVQALANPCLYISENSSIIGLQFACRQLGLPIDSIRLVPCNTVYGSTGTMDISALQKIIANDVQSNRTPLFAIGEIGSTICGHIDNVTRLYDVCKTFNVWLHCRGHNLASLAILQGQTTITPICDSMSLSIGSWLGIPSLPVVCLHRQIHNVTLSIFDSDPIISRRLSALILWTTLQSLGREQIVERLLTAFESCRLLYDIISKCNGCRILSKPPCIGGESSTSILDLINRPVNPSLLFETAVGVVVFQFDGNIIDVQPQTPQPIQLDQSNNNNISNDGQAQITEHQQASFIDPTQAIINKSIEKIANATYFDRLNSWLGQILQRDCPNMYLELVDHPIHGTCMRFCPLELGLGDTVPNIEIIENFSSCLDGQIDILRATVRHRITFNQLVEQSDVLRLINLPDWAGLGGVRFVPDGWETLLTDQAKTELNKLNTDLVDALRSTDNAFSLGEGADGLICVRFGMVTHDTDVEELLDLVISVGKSVQENSRALDSMSEIVKKGIETAQADLQRESDEKLWQEGIFRHVPVFGRVINWWSPPPKESGIKGRSLNLTQGVVESTENIYKYHMQISGQMSSQMIPGNRSPPQPMVQTQVSAGHSRNVSQSSGTSNAEAL